MKKYEAPKEVLQLVKAFSKPSLKNTIYSLSFDWGIIFAAVSICEYSRNWIVYAFAVFVIASRQHALLVLMHEGSHGAFHGKKKWNDRISNWFTAWPLGISTEAYRLHHWKHHRHTNTEEDPDWGRKVKMKEWQFPKTPIDFVKVWVPYFFGKGILEMGFALYLLGKDPQKRFPVPRIIYSILMITIVCLSLGPNLLFLYWLVPFFLALPPLMKVRSIVEHLALPNTEELNGTRNILANPVERFFFGPHSNHLHLVHHLFPQVPWHQLENLQSELLKDPEYKKHSYSNSSYFLPSEKSVLKDLLRTEKTEKAGEASHLSSPENQVARSNDAA